MQTRDLRKRKLEQIARLEAELHVMKLCRHHITGEFWKLLSSWIRDEERASLNRLVEMEGTEAQMREVRAGVRCWRHILDLPTYTDQQYAEAEIRLKVLRDSLQRLDDLGPSPEPDPQWEEQVATIKALVRSRV